MSRTTALRGCGCTTACCTAGAWCAASRWSARDDQGNIDDASTVLTVCPGYALTPQGDEITLEDCATIDMATGLVKPDPCADAWPCPPVTVQAIGDGPVTLYLAIRYAECLARPVRMPPGCGCEEAGCELSRIRSSYELRVLHTLPPSHTEARGIRQQWTTMLAAWAQGGTDPNGIRRQPPPVPPCMPCPDQPWVVLAAVMLQQRDPAGYLITGVDYTPRIVLLPVWALAPPGF